MVRSSRVPGADGSVLRRSAKAARSGAMVLSIVLVTAGTWMFGPVTRASAIVPPQSIVHAQPSPTRTSGVLRDSVTGEAIPNSCVVFSPVSSPGMTNYTEVDLAGYWSFETDEVGPFNLAFYTTANGDCSQPILPSPVPSWYINQPLDGTDEHVIVPPNGATAVPAGSSDVIACLGVDALPTSPCAPSTVALSGTVVTVGNAPLSDVCVIAIGAGGDIVLAISDASGRWSFSGFPPNFSVVLGLLPRFGPAGDPCNSGNGPPPPPAAGKLQPVFYNNIWLNLADPDLLDDPVSWALAHGATLITQPRTGLRVCLTAAAGTVVPRPTCAASAPIDPVLPATGTDVAPLLASGVLLTLLGVLALAIRPRRVRDSSGAVRSNAHRASTDRGHRRLRDR
jgi:hypothetical protein